MPVSPRASPSTAFSDHPARTRCRLVNWSRPAVTLVTQQHGGAGCIADETS
jgi:hypothetical protein